MRILAPSLLAADFKNLERDIKAVEQAGAMYLHLDVMDGAFVPSISFGMPVIKALRSCTDMVFDVHMMVEEPARYVDAVRACGADLICVHAEACKHLVLVMSVNPGFGGQQFIPYTVDKVKALRQKLDELGLNTDIQVDGGVTLTNAEQLLEAGANVIVAGTSVFKGDAGENVRKFLDVFDRYERGLE